MTIEIDDSTERLPMKLGETDLVDAENFEYYRENRDEVVDEYGGQFIAIIDGEVAGAMEPPENTALAANFVDRLKREHGQKKVQSAYIAYVPDV